MRSPAGWLAFTTWAFLVFPTGMPLIGPDMSDDIRLGAVSWETAGLDRSEPMSVGTSSPFGCSGARVYDCYSRICRLALGGRMVPVARGGLFDRAGKWGEPKVGR
jgi:hypothetical protein